MQRPLWYSWILGKRSDQFLQRGPRRSWADGGPQRGNEPQDGILEVPDVVHGLCLVHPLEHLSGREVKHVLRQFTFIMEVITGVGVYPTTPSGF